jgi:hypothetical protein
MLHYHLAYFSAYASIIPMSYDSHRHYIFMHLAMTTKQVSSNVV